MEQGPVERRILEQCKRERLPLPNRIQNAPDLRIGLELYYSAFLDLCSSRGGMGDGPIPWTVVHEYGLLLGLDDDQLDDLHYYVSRMDDAQLKWLRNKQGKAGGNATPVHTKHTTPRK